MCDIPVWADASKLHRVPEGDAAGVAEPLVLDDEGQDGVVLVAGVSLRVQPGRRRTCASST